MKLRLPNALRTALAAVATAALPLATTVAGAAYFSAAASAGTPTSTDLVFTDGTCNLTGSPIYTETLTIDGTKTIYFNGNNRNLGIGKLTLNANSELVLKADRCDLAVINDIAGSGTLTINQNNNGMTWGYHVALYDNGAGGTSTDFTGVINLMKGDSPSNSTHSTVLFLMDTNAANGATIDIGKYTTLAVSTTTAKVAGLTGSDANGAVISYGNTNKAKSIATIDSGSNNCYNATTDVNTNDGELRTLELTGSDTYAYAGAIGSATNATSLNLTKSGSGTQTLSGTVYLNNLTVSAGTLDLSTATITGNVAVSGTNTALKLGTATIIGSIELSEGANLTIASSLASGIIDNEAGMVTFEEGAEVYRVVTTGNTLTYKGATDAAYAVALSDIVRNTSNVTGSFTSSNEFSHVTFANGSTLRVNDTQTLASAPNIAYGSISIVAGAQGHLTIDGAVDYNVSSWTTESSGEDSGSISITGGYSVDGTSSTINGNLSVGANLEVKNGGSVTVSSSGNLSADKLFIHNANSSAEDTFTIDGGVVNVLSEAKTGNTVSDRSGIIIGHWPGGSATLTIENGGVLNALDCVTVISWDSSGTLNINANSEANLYGINNQGRDSSSGKANLNGGRLNLGEGGYIGSGTGSRLEIEAESTGSTLGTLTTATVNVKEDLVLNADLTIDTTVREASTTGKSANKLVEDASVYGTIALTGANTLSGSGSITVTGNGSLEFSHTADTTIANNITFSDASKLVISGSAVETFSGTVAAKAVTVNEGAKLVSTAKDGLTYSTITVGTNASVTLNVGENTHIENISGAADSTNNAVHLNMNSSAAALEDYNTVVVSGLADVYVDSGVIAVNKNSTAKSSDLGSANLHMADGTAYYVRNSTTGTDGATITTGDIYLGGTVALVLYDKLTSDSLTLSSDILNETGLKGTLNVTTGGRITLSGNINLSAIEVNKSTLNISGTLALEEGVTLSNSGSLRVLSGATMDLSNWKYIWQGANKCYSIGTGLTIDAGATWSVEGGTYNSTTGYYSVAGVDHVFTGTSGHDTLVWGGSENNTYDDGVASAASGDRVMFAGTSNVSLAQAVSNTMIRIDSGATVNLTRNEKNLTADISLSGDLVLKDASGTFSGTITDDGGRLIFDLATRNSEGTVTTAKRTSASNDILQAFDGQLVIREGTSVITSGTTSNSKITVESGAQYGLIGNHTGDVYISGNGTKAMNNMQLDYLGALKLSQGTDYKLTGDVYIQNGAASISSWRNEQGHIEGNIIGVDGNSTLTLVNGDTTSATGNKLSVINLQGITTVDTQQGTLTVSGHVTNTAGGFAKQGNGTVTIEGSLTVKDGSTVSYEGGTLNVPSISGAGTIHTAADKTLTLSGDVTHSTGGLTKTGDGTLSIGGALTLKSKSTVDIQGGKIVLGNTDGSFKNYILDGSGTLELTMPTGWDGENTKIVAANTFTGQVHVTSGHVTLSTSTLGQGSWLLDNDVDAQYSSATTQSNDIVLIGSHTIHTNSGADVSVTGIVSGSTFTKAGGATLTFSNGSTLALSSAFSVSNGSLTMEAGSTIDLTNWEVAKTDKAYAFTITNNTGRTTINEGVIWSIAGGTYANGVYTWTAIGDHVVNNKQSFAWGTDNYLGGESSADGATNNVQFVGTSTVTLADNVESAGSTIGAGAEVTVVKNGHSLTATNLTLDGTLKLTSAGTLANGSNFASGSTGVVEVAWVGSAADGNLLAALNNTDVTLRVVSGAGINLNSNTMKFDAVVENGGHIRLDSDKQLTGNITITGDGLTKGIDAQGAIKFTNATLKGDVTIAGGSAAIATWSGESGSIIGAINGSEANSILRFINNNASGDANTLTVTNGLSKISEVEVQKGTMTVDEAATNAGETFTKSGAGTLAVQSISSGESGAAGNVAVEAGTLKLTGETAVAAGKTVTLGTAATMTAGSSASLKSVSLESNGNITGLESLGEMTSVSLSFAADTAAEISNVTMTDSMLSGGSVNLGNNVTAVVSYAAPTAQASLASLSGIPLFGDGPGDNQSATATTLNATPVLSETTAKGTLTVDVDSGLLSPANAGATLVWEILRDVMIAQDASFTLQFGSVLQYLLSTGHAMSLSGDLVGNPTDPIPLTMGNIGNITTGGLITGTTGSLILTVENIPEPTTGTLSVLALAALAARRRRKK